MMRLADVLILDRVLSEMHATNKKEALDEMAALIAGPREELRAEIRRVLTERERLASTAIGDEVAIPHGRHDAVGSLVLAVGRCKRGLDFESVDGKPTRLFFALVAPENATGPHLKALARISRLCKEPLFRSSLLAAADAKEMFEVLCGEDAKLRTL
jgi:PTS system nitrogen regulatory IIA component